jgi:hypothetical protein
MIPEKYHHLFSDETKFLGMDGFIDVGEAKECVISILMDEQGERAFFLCLCDEVDVGGEERFTIIKDFLA